MITIFSDSAYIWYWCRTKYIFGAVKCPKLPNLWIFNIILGNFLVQAVWTHPPFNKTQYYYILLIFFRTLRLLWPSLIKFCLIFFFLGGGSKPPILGQTHNIQIWSVLEQFHPTPSRSPSPPFLSEACLTILSKAWSVLIQNLKI